MVTVKQIRFGDYHLTRDDGVTMWLHAVNADCTGWSIRPVTPGYALPGWWLMKGVPQERVLEIAKEATERAMTVEQERELEARHRTAWELADLG